MGTKNDVKDYIKRWEQRGYNHGIPDEAPVELEKSGLVPSYRMICLAIMRNPNNLESLGIKRKKCRLYSELKRREIESRVFIGKQLKLKL